MPKYAHCLLARQCLLLFLILLSGFWARGADLTCGSHFLNQSFRSEVQKQWAYFDLIKNSKSDAGKDKLKKLLKLIEKHAAANGVKLERDPKNPGVLLVKIIPRDERHSAHSLNLLASSLFEHHEGIRVEINPYKLKEDEAGALFDEDSKRLTLALDNVLDLKADSFVGHELRHAYSTHLEKLRIEHVFMGWLKRKNGVPAMEPTYPDAFSLDEFPAYYYQVLVLLRESKRDPESLKTAQDFIQHGLDLLKHLTGKEFSNGKKVFLTMSDEKYQVAKLETTSYTLEFNFFKDLNRTESELQELAEKRFEDLFLRAQVMQERLKHAQTLLEQSADINSIIQAVDSRRNVIDPKKVFVLD